MCEIGIEKFAKWLLFSLLVTFLLMPAYDLIWIGSAGAWSPLFYIDFLTYNIGGYYGLASIAAAILALVAWGLLCRGHKFGRTLLIILFGTAALIYLLLFFYLLWTIYHRNTFMIELIAYGLKFLLASGVLFLQGLWRRKVL